jgi:hypothetical protein
MSYQQLLFDFPDTQKSAQNIVISVRRYVFIGRYYNRVLFECQSKLLIARRSIGDTFSNISARGYAKQAKQPWCE